MSGRAWLRAGLWFLATTQLAVGAVQLVLPRFFYDEFPWPGHPWVSLVPPYSEHLMRDVGALNLGLGLVVAVAAVRLERVLVTTALAGYVVFSAPHLVFHTTHLEGFPTGDAIAQTVALVIAVALPLGLLPLARRHARDVEAGAGEARRPPSERSRVSPEAHAPR